MYKPIVWPGIALAIVNTSQAMSSGNVTYLLEFS